MGWWIIGTAHLLASVAQPTSGYAPVMATKKQEEQRQDERQETRAEDASVSAADPAVQPDPEAIKQASGAGQESGSQESWKDRYGKEGESA
jgi:hemolysin activation/secretion protein